MFKEIVNDHVIPLYQKLTLKKSLKPDHSSAYTIEEGSEEYSRKVEG